MRTPPASHPSRGEGLPLPGLLALAMAGFITILTEALPAGLLPQIGADLAVSEAVAGQFVTVYAAGSLLAAIPVTAATRPLRRRPLLIAAIAGFAVANTVTTLSGSYALTLAARAVAGISAGLLWALLAGYAARMLPEAARGRAIAVAMAGTPLALSIGIPAGTFLGALIGWRACFGLVTGLSGILIVWVLAALPDPPGQAAGRGLPLSRVASMAGIRPVLAATLTFVLAHTILYTYIAPFLDAAGLGARTDRVLLVFGAASVLGLGIVGLLVDRRLRTLTLLSTALFGLSALGLALGGGAALLIAAVAAWGLAFGGAATLFQTALSRSAGDEADVAQAMLVTTWNLAIAGGGLLLERVGAQGLPPALMILLVPSFLVVLRARHHGFPPAAPPSPLEGA
ncbi:major facilitator superfamily MFS_1 [Methylobacterium sp. 4-46]|uniref:MFS transporter n=1 Tax=unclassified Methylobacterium TaxID=2615210 RepID=UPI000152E138|nr:MULTISPECIES: MFS transporter [Methylobacterium]ACA21069.1 major facilitator superfamily MFS_1 [Methylobacterium sp. 4-46]WFT80218.1 MFS transporter [Methylobacterium nodulans]